MSKAEDNLWDVPYQVVSKYVGGKYIGQYLYRQVTYYGETLVEEKPMRVAGKGIDQCKICGWEGPDADVETNMCPVCGSKDIDDAENLKL